MRIIPLLSAALLTAAGAWANAALAAPPSVEAVAKTCKAGNDPAVQGSTPPQIEGVTTVSPREAKCLVDIFGSQLVVIQAMPDQENQLPNAKLVPDAARFSDDPERRQKIAGEYAKLTQGDKKRPLLVYCHHASCGYSPNAARYAVAAGYQHIFWLREGNSGWGKAGYGFDVGPLDAKGLPLAYTKLVDECDYTRDYKAEDFADDVESSPGDIDAVQREVAKDVADSAASCMGRLKTKFEASPAVQRDIEKRVARTASDALMAVKKARAAVEADPATFFTKSLYDIDVDGALKTVNAARAVRSLTEACGQFNLSLPPVGSNNADFIAVENRFNSYAACFNTNRRFAMPTDFNGNRYRDAQNAFKGIERYTCSVWKGPKCVPDSAYRRVTAVFTPANNELVASALRKFNSMESEADRVRTDLRNFESQYHARFDEQKTYMEQRERPQSYSAPAYAPPQPPSTPVRRASNASAAGIR
jgi:rhodanese-related sulfurtransferase